MQIGIGMFISQILASSGSPYSAEATALFARFSTDPGSTRKTAIDTCITSLKSAGVWAKLEALWVFAAHEDTSARLNWVSTSHAINKVGSPTFTTDRGFTGVSTTGYLVTADNATSYTLFTQNSAHVSVFLRAGGPSPSSAIIYDDLSAGINIYPYYDGSGNIYVRVNDNPEVGPIGTVATWGGMTLGNRSSSTARQGYRNGTSLGSYGSVTSQAVTATPFRLIFCDTMEISAASIGGSLDATEQLAFYNALNTLKTAVGW